MDAVYLCGTMGLYEWVFLHFLPRRSMNISSQPAQSLSSQQSSDQQKSSSGGSFLSDFTPNKYVKDVAKGVLSTATTVTDLAAKLTFLDQLHNFSIRTQILSGTGLSLILLVVITTITFYSVGDLVNRLQAVRSTSVMISEARELERLILQMESAMRGFALSGDEQFVSAYRSSSAAFDTTLAALMQAAAQQPEQIKRLETLKVEKTAWVQDIAEQQIPLQRDIANGTQPQSTMLALVQQGKTRTDALQRTGAAIIDAEEQANTEQTETASIVAIAARSSTVTFTIIAVGIGLFVLSIIAKNISVPIRSIAKATIDVVKGNLDVSVDLRSKNELGILARNFNLMVAKISQAVVDLQQEKESVERKVQEAVMEAETQRFYLAQSVDAMLAAMDRFAAGDLTATLKARDEDSIGRLFAGFNKAVENMNQLMQQVSQAVETVTAATEHISSAASELSAGANEQAAQARDVANSVEEMTRSIIENSQHATTSNTVAQSSGAVAQNGSVVVMQTVKKIETIASVVQQSTRAVETLGQSSIEIGDIVDVISEIADQTNLLALNAAIEAARAGDHGRGFAVVATEVGKLAEATIRATKQIAVIVKKIQAETDAAVHSMKRGNSEVAEGIALAYEANRSLENIVASSNQVTSVIQNIAAASEKQASTSKHIAESIEAMSRVTSESASGVQEIADAASNLTELTQRLNTLIGQFRLRQQSTGSSSQKHSKNML